MILFLELADEGGEAAQVHPVAPPDIGVGRRRWRRQLLAAAVFGYGFLHAAPSEVGYLSDVSRVSMLQLYFVQIGLESALLCAISR